MSPHNLVPSPGPTNLPTSEEPYVLSYFALRKVVGWIAIALPLVVVSVTWALHQCFENSISAYYYTGMRNLFVGALCAIGLFLIACIGYKDDRIPSVIAGICAFLVAFCPTRVPACSDDRYICGPSESTMPFAHSNVIHGVAATVLFVTLAYFCLVLFCRTAPQATERKKTRNKVYLICGVIICAAMATFGFAEILRLAHVIATVKPRNLLFYVETTCLLAFGFAWLVKGQQIFGDSPKG